MSQSRPGEMLTTPYVSTFLGNRFYPLVPCIDHVAIEDIAHGLAYQCRFNGQTSQFYSVAQHSLIVASLVPTNLRLAALLHDAAELSTPAEQILLLQKSRVSIEEKLWCR